MKKKIIITGGKGKFASYFKKYSKKYNIKFPDKNKMNILNRTKLSKYLNANKPDYIIHNAALSRPMSLHEKDIVQSINKNIVGTCNIVTESFKRKIKLIYFSSNYVYPCKKGNYKETDALLPKNNYAWSKLGGECAVQMYKNSLILRLSVTEKPFVHKNAYTNVRSSFIFHTEAASIVMKLIDEMHDQNRLGRKTLLGFYEYGHEKRLGEKILNQFPKREISFDAIKDRLFSVQKSIAQSVYDQGLISKTDANVGAILGLGFCPWTGGPIDT